MSLEILPQKVDEMFSNKKSVKYLQTHLFSKTMKCKVLCKVKYYRYTVVNGKMKIITKDPLQRIASGILTACNSV